MDHPHHMLWVLLALAQANKDEEFLMQGQSAKRRGKLATGRSANLETEVCPPPQGFILNFRAGLLHDNVPRQTLLREACACWVPTGGEWHLQL